MGQPLINITRKQAYIFASFLVLFEFLTYVANDMIMPGMIQVVKTFNGPESAIADSLIAYLLGGASLQLLLGPVSDRYGRRPVMIFGAFLFLLCTLFIAVSNSMGQFIAARYFQGMGLCFIGVIGYSTLQEIFDEMDAIRLIAFMANVAILAPLLGPLLGAFFIHYHSWRMIFVIIAVFSVIALVGLWWFMPESVGQTLRNGQTIERTAFSRKVILTNYKNLLTNRVFLLGSVAFGLLLVPCLAWIALAPIILVTDAKLSVIEYGLWQMPVFGAAIAGNVILQYLTRFLSSKQILTLGYWICILSLILMFILPGLGGNHFLWLMPGLIIYFFGLGIISAPLDRLILFSTPIAKGTTSALLSLITLCIQAGGIHFAQRLYLGHSNVYFGFYCALMGLLYAAFHKGAFYAPRGLAGKQIIKPRHDDAGN